jgi:NTE family protein
LGRPHEADLEDKIMTTRALVLSGGGPVGIAWESGLIGGLAKAGIDLSQADFILGTSAGSFVGARLAMGTTPAELAAPFLAMDDANAPPLPSGDAPKPAQAAPPNAMPMITRLEQARASGKSQREILADIGAYALAAETISEQAFIDSFGKRMSDLPADFWPERNFACTAVDAVDGGFHLWTRDSGVGLARAVASSCSVPGIFPPVTLKGRRYVDGGMRSGSNADQAVGFDKVMVIAIRAGAEGPLAERAKTALDAEIKALTDAGAKVEVVYPDAASITAFGFNLMDARQRPAAAKAGHAQGLAGSDQIRQFWTAD